MKENKDQTGKRKEIIKRIKENPFLYFSSYSKELFHSDFWFWLSEINGEQTAKLFGVNPKEGDLFKFKREYSKKYNKAKSKCDLVISNNEEPEEPMVVIENKLKGFPSHDQLTRISESFADKKVTFFLITLIELDGYPFEDWKAVTYGQLARKINENCFTDNDFHRSLICNYKRFIIDLSELFESLPRSDDYDFIKSKVPKNLYNDLIDIKFWEVYQRMRGNYFINTMRKRIENIDKDIRLDCEINNKKATLGFTMSLKDEYEIGIQIEDNEYRHFIKGKESKDVADDMLKEGLLFSNKFKSKKYEVKFRKYNSPDGKHFYFQYKEIIETKGSTLKKRIEKDLKDIINKKQKIERIITRNQNGR